jgi:hypothetical protein
MAPYFTMVQQVEPADGWHVLAGDPAPGNLPREVVAAQGEDPLEYALDLPGRRIFHVRPNTEEWEVQSLLRVTRAIHRSEASAAGALMLHSGLVELGGHTVALVGSSRAGKTSLIMSAVLGGHGRMVCNDDLGLTVNPGTGRVRGVGWPRSVSVRLDTFDVLLGRSHALAMRAALTHPANETLLRLQHQGIEPHGTALLYPHEYAEITGSEILREAEVSAVVHLGLADDPGGVEFEPVPPGKRSELLEPHILREPNKHLNVFGHAPRHDGAAATVAAVAALPTFHYRYFFTDAREASGRLQDLISHALAGHASPDRSPRTGSRPSGAGPVLSEKV